MNGALPTLDDRTRAADLLEGVKKADLLCGDSVLVRTKNSVYAIRSLGNDLYSVSGGWFDRHRDRPRVVTISGCTWGGSAIKRDIVAALGLYLEFGNRVVTTRIRDVMIVRGDEKTRRRALLERPVDSLSRHRLN